MKFADLLCFITDSIKLVNDNWFVRVFPNAFLDLYDVYHNASGKCKHFVKYACAQLLSIACFCVFFFCCSFVTCKSRLLIYIFLFFLNLSCFAFKCLWFFMYWALNLQIHDKCCFILFFSFFSFCTRFATLPILQISWTQLVKVITWQVWNTWPA